MEMWEIWPPLFPKNPEPMVTKFGMGDEIGDPYPVQNFIMIRHCKLFLLPAPQSECRRVQSTARKTKGFRKSFRFIFFNFLEDFLGLRFSRFIIIIIIIIIILKFCTIGSIDPEG